MFGLTFEKLLMVLVIAAIIIGPKRLPDYARRLSGVIRVVRDALDSARSRAEQEVGLTADEWKALDPRQYDPRQYDPRRIIRDALVPSPVLRTDGATLAAPPLEREPMRSDEGSASNSEHAQVVPDEALADPSPIEDVSVRSATAPVNRSAKVSGSSGHPRRLFDAVALAAEQAPSSTASV